MTKQTINLLGCLVVALILLAGALFGVMPRWHDASQHEHDRDRVAINNQTQQSLIAAYATQRTRLPALQAEVSALKQQIADGPHLEQLIDVAAQLPAGAVLRSITPQDTAAQPGATTPTAPTAAQTDMSASFQAYPVTLVVDLNRAADAPAVLDRLRAGPRLLAIDHVALAGSAGSPGGGKGGSTLTVDGRVFLDQEATP
jgi:hypothetical protein